MHAKHSDAFKCVRTWREGVPTDSRVDVGNPKQTPSVSNYKASALAPRMSTFHKYYLGLANAARQKPERCTVLGAASEDN